MSLHSVPPDLITLRHCFSLLTVIFERQAVYNQAAVVTSYLIICSVYVPYQFSISNLFKTIIAFSKAKKNDNKTVITILSYQSAHFGVRPSFILVSQT